MLQFYVGLQNAISRLRDEEEGQTAIEYGLVLALISVVVAAAVATGFTKAGGPVDDVINKITSAI